MDGNQADIAGDFVSRVGSGAQPPRLSESDSGAEAPPSVQSALSTVRPDDLDAIFDGALFGPPALQSSAEASVPAAKDAAPVPVGAMDWYMERDSQPAGPFRLERLRELWHQGAFDPDTLFWCEAWSTWRPLSRVPELVAAMTVSGLPTVVADASVSPAPAPAKQSGSEKKGLSTLHSLVAEEEGFLRKMQEEKEQEKEEARSALLDESSTPVVAPHLAPVPAPVAPPAPPVVATAVPVVPYPALPMAPPLVPGMMAAPVLPQEPAPSRRGKTFLAGALIGSAAVGLVVGALILLPQVRRAPEQVADASPRPAPAVPQPAPVAVAPVPQPAPAPVAVAPVPQPQPAAVQPPAPVPQPAAPAPQSPAVATAPARPEVKPVPAAVQPEKPKPAVVSAATAVEPKEGTGRRVAAPAVSEERIASAAGSTLRHRQTPPPAPVAPAPAPARKASQADKAADDPTNFDDALDKEFEKQLGISPDSPKYKAEDPRSKRSVYIPPEPGKNLPESLGTSDIVQVVSSHKEAILSCIATHRPAHTSDSGKDRFVVRWRVLPTGDAVDALLETEGLQGTPFARCIEGQVRSWKFPQHRVQSREPVRFPFTY